MAGVGYPNNTDLHSSKVCLRTGQPVTAVINPFMPISDSPVRSTIASNRVYLRLECH